ncbi:MAG: S8 family serine peptidase, partial [Fimbriimonadaceae bacterium]|nr:S8 family serine peptidase [Fimbriimonadaceae bacterium]
MPGEPNYEPVAVAGGLSPASRTLRPWPDDKWPYRPDVCVEGGNYGVDRLGRFDDLDELQLLTTARTSDGRLLGRMADTSAATAQVARMAAILQARYPRLWPETVRALLVHSARWTPAMERQTPARLKEDIQTRLRCFGYGVPDLGRAIWSRENQVCLVYEGARQPFRLDGTVVKTDQYHLHRLPWPREALQALGGAEVTVRVTLSYFIEPSPGNCGWGAKHRYRSHGLLFDMLHPMESQQAFRERVSKPPEDEARAGEGAGGSTVPWVVGPRSRERGSLHSDWWTGTAAAVADCGQLAVYPVHGWWSRRQHLERYDR